MNLDDPSSWKPCNRPLSPAEKMYLFAVETRFIPTATWPFNMPDLQERHPSQARVFEVRVDEELREGVSKFSMPLQPVTI
jgi:hypothetical protein